MEADEPDDIYATLKARLLNTHGIRIKRRAIEEMTKHYAYMTTKTASFICPRRSTTPMWSSSSLMCCA